MQGELHSMREQARQASTYVRPQCSSRQVLHECGAADRPPGFAPPVLSVAFGSSCACGAYAPSAMKTVASITRGVPATSCLKIVARRVPLGRVPILRMRGPFFAKALSAHYLRIPCAFTAHFCALFCTLLNAGCIRLHPRARGLFCEVHSRAFSSIYCAFFAH